MFYSPTILAKKSPMGTVWMAAHLERKIKKAQIEKINIAIYAEKLLFPEVPIALRLSAHLLLGLVRIFAWKVDYTFSDCNRLLTDIRTTIVNIKIDLPADANRALPQSVTLPSNFQLDGIDLDDLADDAEGLDRHQKTFDQITTTDFTAGGGENYVRFLIEENDSPSLSNHSIGGAGPTDDILPPCSDHMQELITNEKNTEGASGPTNLDEGESQFHDTYMDNQFEHAPNENQDNPSENQSDEFHDILRGSQFHIPNENQCQDIPNENQSDAIPNENQSDAIPNENQFHDNISENLNRDSPIEQFRSLHPIPPLVGNSSTGAICQFSASPNNDCNAARDSFTAVELHLDASPEDIILVNQNVPRPSPQRDNDVPSPLGANIQQDAVEFAIAPSPPPAREKRKRKKIQFYIDRHIVLSNKKMKEQLNDGAVKLLMHKRRKLPSSPLDVWRYQRAHIKDQIFDQQLINWKFASLQEKRTYPSVINEEPDMHPPVGPTQQSPNHGISIEESFVNSPVGTMPESPHHDMETVEKRPIKSPAGPLYHSPNHEISIEEPSMAPPYGSPHYETYVDEPTINPSASPTQRSPIDFDAPPERLRCQHVNETIPAPSPPVDLGWRTPNSNNNLLNTPSDALPTFEPEVLDNFRRSPPAKRTRRMSQSPWTPSPERDNFRTPPLHWSAEREDLNFLETPPSVKAKRARIEDGNLSPSVLRGDDSERRERNSWSARSMGMAKYLREHFPVVPNLEGQDGNISLNNILEEKPRKYSARMFFETLVLTSCEYIHVKQEEAYGDILIMPRPRLTATKD